MPSEEKVTADRSVPQRRRRGTGGRRWWAGSELAATPSLAWKYRGRDSDDRTVSTRKLAASLWRQLAAITNGGGSVRPHDNRLGFEFCSLAPIPKLMAEGVTKWDFCNYKGWDNHFESSTAYTRDLFKAPKRVDDGVRWRTKNDSEIKNLAVGDKRERKNCKNIDMKNSQLLDDIAEAKSSTIRVAGNLEIEKKAREDLEDVCENLAKEIEGSKAQIEKLMKQQKRIEMEMEKERKMLQIAEVWREERLQMKMADARLILEDKYAEISNLIVDLEAFLRRLNLIEDEDDVTCNAKALMQAFKSVNIQRVKNLTPKSSSKVSVIKDSQLSDHHHRHKGSHNSEASEISALSLSQSQKKGSSVGKIQKAWSISKDTCKNIMASEGVSGERQVKVQRNPHVVRAMKGHIEWPPRGIPRRSSTANRLKATLESQKTLLRKVLKQRN